MRVKEIFGLNARPRAHVVEGSEREGKREREASKFVRAISLFLSSPSYLDIVKPGNNDRHTFPIDASTSWWQSYTKAVGTLTTL